MRMSNAIDKVEGSIINDDKFGVNFNVHDDLLLRDQSSNDLFLVDDEQQDYRGAADDIIPDQEELLMTSDDTFVQELNNDEIFVEIESFDRVVDKKQGGGTTASDDGGGVVNNFLSHGFYNFSGVITLNQLTDEEKKSFIDECITYFDDYLVCKINFDMMMMCA
jgi:hypothetical protein